MLVAFLLGPISHLVPITQLDQQPSKVRDHTHLKLQINEAKSAVTSAFGRKFLGYELWVAKGKEVKCAVAYKALDNFKARIRQLTRRSGGRSLAQVVEKLRPYLLGWKAYYGMAQTPKVWRELDEWLRHRLRAIQLKHWKRPRAIYRELKALGAKENVARQLAVNRRRWWRNSDRLLKTVLTIAYFDGLGVPRMSLPQTLEPPGADPHARWCGIGRLQ